MHCVLTYLFYPLSNPDSPRYFACKGMGFFPYLQQLLPFLCFISLCIPFYSLGYIVFAQNGVPLQYCKF